MRDVTTQAVQDPAHVIDRRNVKSVLKKERKLVVDYPGQVAVNTPLGQVAGCRALYFLDSGEIQGLSDEDDREWKEQRDVETCESAAEAINLYFSTRANLFIVAIVAERYGGLTAFVSTALDRSELEHFQEAGAYTANIMQAIRGEITEEELKQAYDAVLGRVRLAAEERAKEAAIAAERQKEKDEAARLTELGRTAELQGWKGRIAQLEETVAKYGKAE